MPEESAAVVDGNEQNLDSKVYFRIEALSFAIMSATAGRVVTGTAVGVVGWTLTEYVAHRWAMHGRRAHRSLAAREHRLHHAEPERTEAALRALAYAGIGVASVAISGAAGAVTGRRIAARSAAVAWFGGYTAYEMLHHRAHHKPVRWRLEEPLRERHFDHHLGNPGRNFGVTTPLWDRVFGTQARR